MAMRVCSTTWSGRDDVEWSNEHLHGIKDFYLVPLMVDQAVPSTLLPFTGPGTATYDNIICL